MNRLIILAFGLSGIAIAVFWHSQRGSPPQHVSDKPTAHPALEADTQVTAVLSPFDIKDQSHDVGDAAVPIDEHSNSQASVDNSALSGSQFSIQMPIDWQADRDDDQMLELANALKADPVLLQLAMDSFRQELDPVRRQKLAAILELVGGEQVTLLASELIFSGDPDQRTEGMALLQAVQPGNAMARDIVSGMLATEVEPIALIDALTALAKPGDVDASSRAWLSEQVAWLAAHDDESVRSVSLSILSRWSEGTAHTEVFTTALDDPSRYVRAAAAFALQDHEDNPSLVIERLFAILNKPDEHPRVKSAAILSLKSQDLTSAQLSELRQHEVSLNTRPRQ